MRIHPQRIMNLSFATVLAAAMLALGAAPAAAAPTFTQTEALEAPPGILVTVSVAEVFDDEGTNARFNSAAFSSYAAYYNTAGIHLGTGSLGVEAKPEEDLRYLTPPPPNPFTVTVDVTMTNDEGEEASGTLTFSTTYSRATNVQPPAGPTFSQTAAISAAPDAWTTVYADGVFNNAGTNPRFTQKSTSSACLIYCALVQLRGRADGAGHLNVKVKTNAQLSVMSPLPDNPFTFTVDVTMTNDEGQTATGTITFQTSWSFVAVKIPGTIQ